MTTTTTFDTFYKLHQLATPLVLANAWNVKSAQVIEKAGYAAIGTSSGAIADSLGYKDGEQIPFDDMLSVVKRISACTRIPLTVDFERGYTQDLATLQVHVQRLLDLGVAGINLEDAEGEEGYLQKLFCIKNYLVKTGQRLFINARTDGFLLKLDAPLETTLRRAKLYRDGGADGLFVTGVADTGIIREICAATTLPVNVVGVASLSSIPALTDCGVRRISMAGFLYGATYKQMGVIAREVLEKASLEGLHG